VTAARAQRFGATRQCRQDGTDISDPKATIVRNLGDGKLEMTIFLVTGVNGVLVTAAVTVPSICFQTFLSKKSFFDGCFERYESRK
jgi:hypothetical protein